MRGVALLTCGLAFLAVPIQSQRAPTYRVESRSGAGYDLRERFTGEQLALIEKLNRADLGSLESLPQIVLPDTWNGLELSYCPLPRSYAAAAGEAKLLVVHLPGQAFGAYEAGVLVRWGPISSGSSAHPTLPGRFTLNWRSAGRSSTDNPEWFMRWYFNFGNREGLAFHEQELPGHPASHGCVRLLERDARWLFEWGEGWVFARDGTIAVPGTPVSILGAYDFGAAPPWRSLDWLAQPVELPAAHPSDLAQGNP